MKTVSCRQMQELDRKTSSEYGIPGEILMDRAGEEVAEAVRYLAGTTGSDNSPVTLIAGRGNNGGDAFAAARYLKESGCSVDVWLAGDAAEVKGDALKHLGRMKAAGITLRELPTKRDWEDAMNGWGGGAGGGIVVDGILGVGISGPARGPAAGAIAFVNHCATRSFVLAIDVPSGLNADTGEAEGDAVLADMTLTIGLPKRGLVDPRAVNYVGSLEVGDIGIPPVLHAGIRPDVELITAGDLRPLMRRRPRNAHKGMFGHVLVAGGATGYAGAIAMAAKAALRSGAGLVTAFVPECVASTVAALAPEAMVHPCPQTDGGSLRFDGFMNRCQRAEGFDSILAGPGMTQHGDTGRIVEWLLKENAKPLILDADAINVCAARPELLRAARCPIIITPHPGEAARLMRDSSENIQSDRFKWAGRIASETGAVVVLKGAGTVVARTDCPLHIAMVGNPGMATGGMGDVLSGLLAGIAAQGIAPFDAARLAVYVHGKAGDYVAWRTSQAGTVAGDVIDELPVAFRDVSLR